MIDMIVPYEYFREPSTPRQRLYEALRSHFIDGISLKESAKTFGYKYSALQRLSWNFRYGEIVFFPVLKGGPQGRTTPEDIQEKIVAWRKHNKSVTDIRNIILEEENVTVSISTIDRILRDEGFAPLPKRTYKEIGKTKQQALISERSYQLDFNDIRHKKFDCDVAGIYLFIPFLLELELDNLIRQSSYPNTDQLSNLNYIYSILALKLMGKERLSQISDFGFDYGLGFFAGLNVLPKATAISTYSYGIDKEANYNFMKAVVKKIRSLDDTLYSGKTINLDFHTIPHYGEKSTLEKNWFSQRGKAMKSALTFFAQDGDSQFINYANTDIRRKDAPREILNFVDYWLDIKGVINETLVFDSRLTNYQNLKQLDDLKVKFITLRRRGNQLVEKYITKPRSEWKVVELDIPKRKYNKFLAIDETIPLGKFHEIRQIVIREHGRDLPTFLITNNYDFPLEESITLYARRWRIENKLSELVDFFSLNALSSPIAIRIHFDVLITVVADTLYKLLSRNLLGFESKKAPQIFSKFVDRSGNISINDGQVTVKLKKNAYTPILKSCDLFRKPPTVDWWNDFTLKYDWQ